MYECGVVATLELFEFFLWCIAKFATCLRREPPSDDASLCEMLAAPTLLSALSPRRLPKPMLTLLNREVPLFQLSFREMDAKIPGLDI